MSKLPAGKFEGVARYLFRDCAGLFFVERRFAISCAHSNYDVNIRTLLKIEAEADEMNFYVWLRQEKQSDKKLA